MSTTQRSNRSSRPRVVVLGGGFGGLYAARVLRAAAADVTLIDRTNHHVFQPLLYQVATAVLAPSDIASPIRYLLRKQRNTTVLMAEVKGIDVDRRAVMLGDGTEVPYDYVIVATGSRHSYFAHPEWEPIAPGLKSIEDARLVRHRFLSAFELAEKSDDVAERDALMTFVIVGGGPTGVELAGMIPDITHHSFAADFRRIDTSKTRIILVEAGPRLLPAFPEHLAKRAQRDLEELGVEIRLGSPVTNVAADSVSIGTERIAARSVFWAAGNVASPVVRSLGAPMDRVGRVEVLPDLSIPDHPEVFVVGDLAAMKRDDGTLVPGVAQGAIQSGRMAAKNIRRLIDREPTKPFHYFNKGDLATIGRYKAVANFPGFTIAGRIAWWFWLFLHILYLAGFRNRLSVLLEWGYAYFTYERGARLITKN
ncbi:MAG: NAD(P)/FAD-dependent oxidoreductase [Gemmatimonadota bacterium]|nr:NAD(P)/FAD-dependent oxidoreductase [Gemmatimonadota bacterium]